MRKILTIVGARPQFIKAAAVSHAIRDYFSTEICEDILHTGQHYDDAMSAQFFEELDIPAPKYNLGVGSGTHGVQTARMIEGIEKVLAENRYDGVLVYGDTNSTLAGALAAAKIQVPVFHVEAGLRSYNNTMPEELNRVLTDHASTLLFAPTKTAVDNLLKEGINNNKIIMSGDIMLDSVMHYAAIANNTLDIRQPYIFATIHRNFNTDSPERLNTILSAIEKTARKHASHVLFPIHPRTKQQLKKMGINTLPGCYKAVAPLSYLETLSALKGAKIVMTDSGGLQKEAFFSGKTCVVLRKETEWTEIIDCGAAITTDANERMIVEAADKLWDIAPCKPTQFGDGTAAKIIVSQIISAFNNI